MKPHLRVLPLALLCLGAVHVGVPDPSLVEEPASFVAPEDKALVVFSRPKPLGKSVYFYVFDENKKLRTLFKGNDYVSMTIEPGKHTLYVVCEDAKLVRAELAAGRTYVVRADAKMGWGKARVQVVQPARRGSPSFAESVDWIAEAKPGEPNFKKGEKWTSKRQDVLHNRMTAAEEDWAKMDDVEREAVTLRPDDGRTPEEAKELNAR
jgi:hypothetical protein